MRAATGSVLFAVAGVAGTARGDDPSQGETPHVEKGGEGEVDEAPELELVLWPQARGLGGSEQREQWTFERGASRIDLTGVEWANHDDAALGQVVLDSRARGWTAGSQVSHDLRFARLTLHGSVGQVDNELGSSRLVASDASGDKGVVGRGRYRELGVSLRRTFRLSRTMHAWVSLSVGHRAWSKASTLDEPDTTEVMLSIGSTF
jgi:hypothetical protein